MEVGIFKYIRNGIVRIQVLMHLSCSLTDRSFPCSSLLVCQKTKALKVRRATQSWIVGSYWYGYIHILFGQDQNMIKNLRVSNSSDLNKLNEEFDLPFSPHFFSRFPLSSFLTLPKRVLAG